MVTDTTAETLFEDIQELYHSVNVYKSIIVSDDHEQLAALYERLHQHDYPVDPPTVASFCIEPSAGVERFLQHQTRMLLLSSDAYEAVVHRLPLEDCVLIRAPTSKL